MKALYLMLHDRIKGNGVERERKSETYITHDLTVDSDQLVRGGYTEA